MADSKCCFGCSDVRRGAWIIALFNMLICIVLTIRTVWEYNDSAYNNMIIHSSTRQNTYDLGNSMSYYNTTPRHIQMANDFNLFTRLFIIFLFFYVNLNLKRATYLHNTQSINHWLINNSIFFIFFVIYVGFTTIKNSVANVIPVGIPVGIVTVYQIYVVKCFYEDELKFMANSERNILTQATVHRQPFITVNNQTTMQTPAYPVQAGPYIIQQVHQPVAQTPYPQQTYQYPHPQQQPSQSHVVIPPPESQTQEYCNPPPYSPNYNMAECPSVKQ